MSAPRASFSLEPPAAMARRPVVGTECPLNDGLAVLDLLLCELIGEDDPESVDAALDLRSLLMAESPEGEIVIAGIFRLRANLSDRHYLAFYRLRRWLASRMVARVFAQRGNEARTVQVRLDALDAPDLDRLRAQCADAAGISTPWVRVHFVYQAVPAALLATNA